MMFQIESLEAESPVDALDEGDDERLPGDEVADPVQQLPVEQVRLLPWVLEQPLQVHLDIRAEF